MTTTKTASTRTITPLAAEALYWPDAPPSVPYELAPVRARLLGIVATCARDAATLSVLAGRDLPVPDLTCQVFDLILNATCDGTAGAIGGGLPRATVEYLAQFCITDPREQEEWLRARRLYLRVYSDAERQVFVRRAAERVREVMRDLPARRAAARQFLEWSDSLDAVVSR
jgi:hypothetical protein